MQNEWVKSVQTGRLEYVMEETVRAWTKVGIYMDVEGHQTVGCGLKCLSCCNETSEQGEREMKVDIRKNTLQGCARWV